MPGPRKSIFGRLFSYRPRDGKIPEEDYFTEAFAGVLERDPVLCKSLFRFFSGLEGGSQIDNVEVETQRSFPSASGDNKKKLERPDLTLTAVLNNNTSVVVLVESKISSSEGKNQLTGYAELLYKHDGFSQYHKKILAYISKYPDENKKDKNDKLRDKLGDIISFKQFVWADVYKKVKEHLQNNADSIMTRELKQFMEEMGMSNEIRFGDMVAMKTYKDSIPRMTVVLDQAWKRSMLSRINRAPRSNATFPDNESELSFWYPLTTEVIHVGYGYATNKEKNHLQKFDIADNGLPVAFVILQKVNNSTEYRNTKQREIGKLCHDAKWKAPDGQGYNVIAYTYQSVGEIMGADPYNNLVEYFKCRLNELHDAIFAPKPDRGTD